MKRQAITLTNDFHQTAITLRAKVLPLTDHLLLNPRQVRKAARALCAEGCLCGREAGTRGMRLAMDLRQDGSLVICTHTGIYT